jgi:LmbE family N-acetylglucosaminyl deacetylase
MGRIADILAGFEKLPKAGLQTILQGRKPMILAPHPDDESLGCGGLIAAACAAGTPPLVIILTDGSASHPDSKLFPPHRLAEIREQETLQATRLLGLPGQNLHFFRQPDSRLAAGGDFEALVRHAATLGEQQGCKLVIGPWHGDPHCDHEATAGIAAAVALRCSWPLLSYPVWGWLRDPDSAFEEPRKTGWRLDISEYLPCKRRAIAAHVSQYGELIPDSPLGFRLPQNLLSIFERPFEVFIG